LGIEPNQFSQPEDGGGMFYRNVGAFNHYMVQNPKRIPSYEAVGDDVSCWLDVQEIAQACWSILCV
jgi:hypothetical protein